jgi:Ni,Fe-hydrogenase maturation factor
MTWPRPVRVVGVGSPFGDDAAAWEVVRQLQRQKEWGGEIEFHAVEGGHRLIDLLDGRGTLFLVDALAAFPSPLSSTIGGEGSVGAWTPGTIERLEWPDTRLEALRPGTTHHLRPAEALQLAAALNFLPARVVVWGIAGECFDPPSRLSPAVAAAVPLLVQQIVAELQAPHNRR